MEGFLGLKRNTLVLKQECLFSLNFSYIKKKKKRRKKIVYSVF